MIVPSEIFCLNELGKRANNEDSVSPKRGTATKADRLFIVCDGVGGENKGEVASEVVSSSIQAFVKGQLPAQGGEIELIEKAIDYANRKLLDYVQTDVEAKRMSTTLALVMLGADSVTAAWCGDTRIHHIRDGKILWRSKDHSLVSELVSQGELTEEEARRHPRRNVITRSLNAIDYNNEVDFHEIHNFESGDWLLLCTDGFLENATDSVIAETISNNGQDKAKAFLSVCEGATRDNFSMYLIKGVSKPKTKRRLSLFWLILLLSVSIALLYFALYS